MDGGSQVDKKQQVDGPDESDRFREQKIEIHAGGKSWKSGRRGSGGWTPDRVDVMEMKMLQLLLREILNASARHLIAAAQERPNARLYKYPRYYIAYLYHHKSYIIWFKLSVNQQLIGAFITNNYNRCKWKRNIFNYSLPASINYRYICLLFKYIYNTNYGWYINYGSTFKNGCKVERDAEADLDVDASVWDAEIM